MSRLAFLAPLLIVSLWLVPAGAADAPFDSEKLAQTVERASALPRLHALIVARDGKPAV